MKLKMKRKMRTRMIKRKLGILRTIIKDLAIELSGDGNIYVFK